MGRNFEVGHGALGIAGNGDDLGREAPLEGNVLLAQVPGHDRSNVGDQQGCFKSPSAMEV